MFLISGKNKAEAVRNCLNGEYDPLSIPVQFLLHHHPGPISFFCDRAAASGLEEGVRPSSRFGGAQNSSHPQMCLNTCHDVEWEVACEYLNVS